MYTVKYIDKVTAPGVNRLLAEETDDKVAPLRAAVEISMNQHGSTLIADEEFVL
jgi:hypothetical protein